MGVRVVSRDEFVGYWEYLLENAIYTTPPYQNYGGAALIGPDGSLLGIGSIFSPGSRFRLWRDSRQHVRAD